MPHFRTVWKWEQDDAEFQELSTRAREVGTHYMADDCIAIGDGELPNDPETARVEVQHRKLKIDTRLRLIGKWNARRYGDKLDVTSDGKALNLPAELEAARRRVAKGDK